MDLRLTTDTYRWVHSSAYSSIPPEAVIGGNDSDGTVMYVGRAFHNGDTLVAKVLPSKHIAFVSWRGEVIPKEHFEILCGQNLVWVHCYDHQPPENAVICGETSLGQPVYIGRGHYNGSLTVGKVSSVHRALFIAYSGSEKRLESYEILVHNKGPTPGWALPLPLEEKKPLEPLEEDLKRFPASPTPPPPPPPLLPPPPPYSVAAYPPNAPVMATLYELPPSYQSEIKPTHISPQLAEKYVPAQVINPPYISPYVPPPPPSITPAETYVPPPQQAYTPAETYAPPPGISSVYTMWVQANAHYLPPNAFPAGQDSDFSTLYICRAYHNGYHLPGKLNPSHGCAYVCCDGRELPKYSFEVLVGDRFRWVGAYNGIVPPGAVEGGRTPSGEVLYVGRGHHNGTTTPGKVHSSHGCLYIPYGGQEIRLMNYEVLVHW